MNRIAFRIVTTSVAVLAFAGAGVAGATAESAAAAPLVSAAASTPAHTQQFDVKSGGAILPDGPSRADYELASGSVVTKNLHSDNPTLVVNAKAKTGQDIALIIDIDQIDGDQYRAVVSASVDETPVGVFSCVATFNPEELLLAKSFTPDGGLAASFFIRW